MKWTRGSKYHWTSGSYCINAVKVAERPVYLAYAGNELLGRTDDAESARKLCVEHERAKR